MTGFALISIAALMTISRAGSDGAYWLLTSAYRSGGLYYQEPGERELHPMRGFDPQWVFDRWSPDKKWLYFQRTFATYNATTTTAVLSRMRVGSMRPECLGTRLYPFGQHSLTDFVLSPDFERVAYASPDGEANGLYITRGGCQNSEPIWSNDGEIIDGLFWSPEGDWLYFHTTHETLIQSRLYRVRPDGGDVTMLTRTFVSPAETSKRWQWSPNGEWILLTACRGRCSLYSFAADGSQHAQILDSVLYLPTVVWSGEEDWFFFNGAGEDPSQYDIFRARPDGELIEAVTQRPLSEFPYRTTADGEWIMFGSFTQDYYTLERMRPDGSNQHIIFTSPFAIGLALPVSDEWLYMIMTNLEDSDGLMLYRLRPGRSDADLLMRGDFSMHTWHITPDNEYLMTVSSPGDTFGSAARLFLMRLDGSEQEYVPMPGYEFNGFSPLFNLPFRAWMVMLVGAVMLFSPSLSRGRGVR
jgi:Tol biopolymer transport system component